MHRISLLLIGMLMALSASAEIKISSGGKYYFACDLWESGCMVVGSRHDVAPFIYYDADATTVSADGYWVLTLDGGGYTICNAVTKEYIIYKDERLTNDRGEYTAKGLQLATSVSDNSGRWIFNEKENGSVYITCVADPSVGFNVRTDGTGLVGTYPVSGTANEFFHVYDENGNSIVSEGTSGGGGGTGDDHGVTLDGMYWENTGLPMPVVLTTVKTNPILYHIKNVRSGMYAQANESSQLYQSKNQPTNFYFMANGNDVNIYTESGDRVSTQFWTFDEGKYPLSLTGGVASSGRDVWNFEYSYDIDYPGYAICKQDNLAEDDPQQSEFRYWNDYNLNTYNCIGLYDCDGGSTFVFYSKDQRHKAFLEAQGLKFDESGGNTGDDNLDTLLDSLRLGDKDFIYESYEKVYYYPLPETVRGNQDWTTQLTARWKVNDGTYHVEINGIAPDENGEITLPGGLPEQENELVVYRDGTDVAHRPIVFTYLPLVEINVPSCNGKTYTTGSIRVTDPNMAGYDSTFIAAYKYRGASAQNYAKKSFAIKLRDADGNSVDREFFGLRNDNNWILDAMAIDRACMRNRVSTDLWNDFATKPLQRRMKWEPKAKHGTRGRFVEVILNGRYHGIYCMTEKMDRKQLRLKKFVPATATSADTIHGSLYKSSQWSYEVFMGHDIDRNYFPGNAPSSYNNNLRQETWCDYEVKYPDYEDEKIDWGPLWNAINFTATSTDDAFKRNFDTYFERANIDDYYLFIELMLATDNHGKNMFFYNFDQLSETVPDLIGVAPWDLDGTWGRRWDGSKYLTGASQDFTNFLWAEEHGTHTIFHRLAAIKSIGWEADLKARYAQLRPQYFNTELLQQRFRDYASLFAESGADTREQNRWSSLHSDISTDVDYICDWIAERIEFLDRQYDFDPATVGIGQNTADSTPYYNVVGGRGCISIHAPEPVSLRVYSIGGQYLRTIDTEQSQTVVGGFQPGIYIIGTQKVVVR